MRQSLSLQEACEVLGLCEDEVISLIRDGQLKAHRVGDSIKIYRRGVFDWKLQRRRRSRSDQLEGERKVRNRRWLAVFGLIATAGLCLLWSYDLRYGKLPGKRTLPGRAPIQLEPEAHVEALRLLSTPGADGKYFPAFIPMYEEAKAMYESRKLYSTLLAAGSALALGAAGAIAWRSTAPRATKA